MTSAIPNEETTALEKMFQIITEVHSRLDALEDKLARRNRGNENGDGSSLRHHQGGRGQAKRQVCFRCRKPGHFVRNCLESRAAGRKGQEKGGQAKQQGCFRCGGPGHFARNCRVQSCSDAPGSQPTREGRLGPFLPQLSFGQMCRRQWEDPTVGPILSSWPAKPIVDSDNWQLDVLTEQHDRLLCRKGVLYRRVMDPKQGACEQLVIPSSLQSQVLTSCHRHLGHLGFSSAAELLRPHAYWPGMYRELEEFLANCKSCSETQVSTNQNPTPVSCQILGAALAPMSRKRHRCWKRRRQQGKGHSVPQCENLAELRVTFDKAGERFVVLVAEGKEPAEVGVESAEPSDQEGECAPDCTTRDFVFSRLRCQGQRGIHSRQSSRGLIVDPVPGVQVGPQQVKVPPVPAPRRINVRAVSQSPLSGPVSASVQKNPSPPSVTEQLTVIDDNVNPIVLRHSA